MPSGARSSRKSKNKKDKSERKKGKESRGSNKKRKDKGEEESHKEEKTGNNEGRRDPIEIYGAVYTPAFGNYYDWALAMYNPSTNAWLVFQVTQEPDGGPFVPQITQRDPRSAPRCITPLMSLGYVEEAWMVQLEQLIYGIQVPGEAASWNCQDYVLEIWEAMMECGMISSDTWQAGRDSMMPYYS